MTAYTKSFGLAVERKGNPDGLERIGKYAFTREKAENLRDQMMKFDSCRPVYVINLNAE